MDSISSLEYYKQIANYLNRAWKDKFEDERPILPPKKDYILYSYANFPFVPAYLQDYDSWKGDISNFWIQNRRISRTQAARQLSSLSKNLKGYPAQTYLLNNLRRWQDPTTEFRLEPLKPHQYLALSVSPPWEHLFFLGLLKIRPSPQHQTEDM